MISNDNSSLHYNVLIIAQPPITTKTKIFNSPLHSTQQQQYSPARKLLTHSDRLVMVTDQLLINCVVDLLWACTTRVTSDLIH